MYIRWSLRWSELMTIGTNRNDMRSGRTAFRADSGLRSSLVVRGFVVLALGAVVAIVFATLPRMLGTESLSLAEPIEDGVINFLNDDGERIGTFFTRVDNFEGQPSRLVVQVPSQDGYGVDSVSLRFVSQNHLPVSLTATSYDVDYRLAQVGLGETVFEVDDLGDYGRGTVNFDFLLGHSEDLQPARLLFDVRRHSTSYPYQKQQMEWFVELKAEN